MGVSMIVLEGVEKIWSEISRASTRAEYSDDLKAFAATNGAPVWHYVATNLVNFAIVVLLGIGVIQGRGWAFLMTCVLLSLRLLNALVVTHAIAPLPSVIVLGIALNLVTFVYTGIRLTGGLGPRPANPFAKNAP